MSAGPPVGVVTALAAEAAAASGAARAWVVAGGAGAGRARAAAERLVDGGAAALVSFGLGGGLDPALGTGAIVVGTWVEDAAGRRLATEPAWAERLARRLAPLAPHRAGVVQADAVVATPPAKRALGERTGAALVDMESAAVGEVATRHRLAFAVLRAVIDPVGRDLPEPLLRATDPWGRPRWPALGAALARRPASLVAAVALGAARARALGALRRAVRLAGPGVGREGT